MSIFGWDLPPGCSMRDIEDAQGEGLLDCPVCADGVEMEGPDCSVDDAHGPTCPKHGCVACQGLEGECGEVDPFGDGIVNELDVQKIMNAEARGDRDWEENDLLNADAYHAPPRE